MNYKLILLAALVVLATGRPQTQEDYPPAKYDFQWEVVDPESGNNFNQYEARDGDETEGRYEVLLPDERNQIVVYSVRGDGGFEAEVTYEGEAAVQKR